MSPTRKAGIDRRQLLAAAPAAALAACAAPRAQASAPQQARNLLVILADDLSGEDMGCYGSTNVRTPHIDALAARGMLFERAYTAVGVCQPSRSSMYTGLYPTGHGALGFGPISPGVETWPQLLAAAGVFTAMIGKLDVDPAEQFPFEHLVRSKDMASRRDSAVWRREFARFLGAVGERRFAAVISLSDPHRPFNEEPASEPRTSPEALKVPAFLWDAPGVRADLAAYYDCVARLDRTVGELLVALRDAGHADDTLIVFTSDNGAAFPFAKATLYEAGVRMPLIVAGPLVRAGARNRDFASLLDLLPTALEQFGAPARTLDGRSLLAALRGEGLAGPQRFVTMQTENNRERSAPARALHTPRYKYIRNLTPEVAMVSNVVNHTPSWEAGVEAARSDERVKARMQSYLYRPSEELFDLERDPCELENLAARPEHAARLTAMREELRAWLEARQDPALAQWA